MDTIETRRSNLDGRRVLVTQRQWIDGGVVKAVEMYGVIECAVWNVAHRMQIGYRVRLEEQIPFCEDHTIYAHEDEVELV